MTQLDLDILEELRDLLDDGLGEILDEFALHINEQIDALEVSLESRDLAECGRLAHTLKGSAGNVGAIALSRTAANIEQYARDDDLTQASTAVAELPELAALTIAELVRCGYLKT